MKLALPAASVAGRFSSGCLDGIDLLVGQAELITGKARALLRRRDRHLAFKIEIRCRRAIEETSGDVDFGRRPSARCGRSASSNRTRCDRAHNLRPETSSRRPAARFGSVIGTHVPCAGRRRSRQRQGQSVAADALVRRPACGGIRRHRGVRPRTSAARRARRRPAGCAAAPVR